VRFSETLVEIAFSEGDCRIPAASQIRVRTRLCNTSIPIPSQHLLLPHAYPTCLPPKVRARPQTPEADGGPLCGHAGCFQDGRATDTGRESGGIRWHGGKGTTTWILRVS